MNDDSIKILIMRYVENLKNAGYTDEEIKAKVNDLTKLMGVLDE